MPGRLLRVAHRGGSLLAPENTMAAFRLALTFPVDAIECDVHMSRDGHLIVFHDNTVERLTEGEGNILDLDFAYLRSLNAAAHFSGGWPEAQQIPTLQEVLELVKGRLQICIEIKTSKRDDIYGRYPGIAQAVVKEVQTIGMVRNTWVISFDWQVLQEVKTLEPTLRIGAIVSRDNWDFQQPSALYKLAQSALALKADGLFVDCRLFTDNMLTVAHRYGLQLDLWTVNSEEELRYLATAGVDALTTDRPDLFARL